MMMMIWWLDWGGEIRFKRVGASELEFLFRQRLVPAGVKFG